MKVFKSGTQAPLPLALPLSNLYNVMSTRANNVDAFYPIMDIINTSFLIPWEADNTDIFLS